MKDLSPIAVLSNFEQHYLPLLNYEEKNKLVINQILVIWLLFTQTNFTQNKITFIIHFIIF